MIEYLSGIPSQKIIEKSNGYFYLIPQGIIPNNSFNKSIKNKKILHLINKKISFCAFQLIISSPKKIYSFFLSVQEVLDWIKKEENKITKEIHYLINNLTRISNTFCGFDLDKPLLMGVLNVTPDSFSDGGKYININEAVNHSLDLMDAGASIIDVGGESTRPGAIPVNPSTEQERIIPIVKILAEKGIVVSVDTMHASTMDLALNSGARIINDISALRNDKESIKIIKKNKAHVILMHMQGMPSNMQQKPSYNFAPIDVYNFFHERVEACEKEGIAKEMISIDPGIGFGKSHDHNIDLLKNIMIFHMTGLPLVLGISRKSIVGKLTGQDSPENRVVGSVSLNLVNAIKGVDIFRVHDVNETNYALKTLDGF